MAERVSGNVDDVHLHVAKADLIAAGQVLVDTGYLFSLARRAEDAAAGFLLDELVAAGMVGMPVGVPDLIDGPAAIAGLDQIFLTIWRINGDGRAALWVVCEKAVIDFQAGELVNFDHDTI